MVWTRAQGPRAGRTLGEASLWAQGGGGCPQELPSWEPELGSEEESRAGLAHLRLEEQRTRPAPPRAPRPPVACGLTGMGQRHPGGLCGNLTSQGCGSRLFRKESLHPQRWESKQSLRSSPLGGAVPAYPSPLSIQGTCLQGPRRGSFERQTQVPVRAGGTEDTLLERCPILEGTRRRDTPGDRSHQSTPSGFTQVSQTYRGWQPWFGEGGWVKKVHTIQVNRFKRPSGI